MENEKSILSKRIKSLRNDLNLTQEDLAKKLGLNNKSSIANYESGYSIPSDEIKLKMCEIFGCTMDYLMGQSEFKTHKDNLDNYMINQNKQTILNTINRYYYEYIVPCSISEQNIDFLLNLLSDVNEDDVKKTKEQLNLFVDSFSEDKRKKVKKFINIIIKELISDLTDKSTFHYLLNLVEKNNKTNTVSEKYYLCPVYGQISAGQPNWAAECIEGRLPIDPDLMGIVNPQEHFFLRVNGESMNNVVKNGAFALIHKQDMVEDGEIAVVLVNGYDATLKRFTKKGDVVVLEPDSTDPSFKTQIYDKTTSIKILGKYVGKMEINK